MPVSDKASSSSGTSSPGTQKTLIRAARTVFIVAIVVFLAFQLTRVGWAEIWHELPTHPLFYLIFALIYFTLPVTEALIYRRLWRIPFREALPVFLKKRVFNKDVLGYSGEVYLYWWARRHPEVPPGEALGVVKDNAITSSAASTAFAVTVLGALLVSGRIPLLTRMVESNGVQIAIGLLAVALLVGLGIRFRATLFRLSGLTLLFVFAVHFVRLLIVQVLQVVQWAVVMPEVPLNAWLTFVAILIVTSRIPLVPARDLIFLSVSVEMSSLMDIQTAAVASMLLVASLIDKMLNIVLFSGISLFRKKSRPAEPEPGSMPTNTETMQRDVL